ncbi:hypothetical protein GCM10023185_37270 [Hymenobacter saemangeumensis]|uniref:Uncharacterized protein n=1 Tax=Hymenobacter saemangeumensis TaxID=1084522 RepID=A0ABP8IRA1_9BACT
MTVCVSKEDRTLILDVMPPCLDIYIATRERTLTCIHRFLSAYADLTEDAVRDDFEVRPTGSPEGFISGTLATTLAYGLAQADRAFTLYFHGQPPNYRPMLYFSPHGRLLLGLSVEASTPEGASNDAEAEHMLQRLKAEFNTEYGLIAFELPPEEADEEFPPHLF